MKKIALLVFTAFSAAAMGQTYGRMDFQLQTAMGQAVAGAYVSVYTQPACGTPVTISPANLATLYATVNGTVISNPLITDGHGETYAYVSPSNCYTVVYYSQYTGTQTFADQSVRGFMVAVTPSTSNGLPVTVSGGYSGNQQIYTTPVTVDQSGNLSANTVVSGEADMAGASNSNVNHSIAGFPQKLLGFIGYPHSIINLDGKSWDANGLGAPSNPIFLKGQYWVCSAGYPTSAMASQSIGCWYGSDMNTFTAYASNPIMVNSQPSWATACIEGPMLYSDGTNVYMSFNGYPSACDSFGTGNIGMVQTTVADFPNGWSTMGPAPLISKPSGMNWLYRPDIFYDPETKLWYNYSNGGDNNNTVTCSGHTGNCIIGYFTAPAITGPWTYQGTAINSDIQSWTSGGELQDPQVWQDPSGLWIMLYGGSAKADNFGFAYSYSAAGPWTPLPNNPILSAISTNLYLPKIGRDVEGDYWLFSASNNNPAGIFLAKAVGAPAGYSSIFADNSVNTSLPAWFYYDYGGGFALGYSYGTSNRPVSASINNAYSFDSNGNMTIKHLAGLSSTSTVTNLNSAPIVYGTSGTQYANAHYVKGTVSTTTIGTAATVNLSGAAVFSDTSYGCWGESWLHASSLQFYTVSNSEFAVISSSANDSISFFCIGN